MTNEERARKSLRQHKLIRLTIGLLILVLVLALARDREPFYQGHTASEWMEGVPESKSKAELEQTRGAFQAMGKDAVLFFSRELQLETSGLERLYLGLIHKITGKTPGHDTAPHRRRRAAFRLRFLHREGWLDIGPAIPALVKQLNHPDPSLRMACANTLSEVSTHSELIVPKLIPLLSSPEAALRSLALAGLSNHPSSAKTVTPLLQKLVQDSNSAVFRFASEALMKLAPEKRVEWLSPQIRIHLLNTNPIWRGEALRIIYEVCPQDIESIRTATRLLDDPFKNLQLEAISKLPVLATNQNFPADLQDTLLKSCLKHLESPDDVYRKAACVALIRSPAQIGKPALPKLVQVYERMVKTPNSDTELISQAIHRISPEKAKELGITGP